eukprot:scaffold60893_cov59-Cyclotella_meneghiniana.AAC.4
MLIPQSKRYGLESTSTNVPMKLPRDLEITLLAVVKSKSTLGTDVHDKSRILRHSLGSQSRFDEQPRKSWEHLATEVPAQYGVEKSWLDLGENPLFPRYSQDDSRLQ